jgi:hypothetical protein
VDEAIILEAPVADDFDLNDLLERAAAGVRLAPREFFDATPDDERLELLEAFKKPWNKQKHPRWPKGTPKAGQFMRVGERFSFKGVDYEVALNTRGRVYAHVASGQYADVATVEFKGKKDDEGALTVPGITAAQPKQIVGGKSSSSNVTVVEPYVDHDSHDSSLPTPEGLTDDQWQKFGKLDQEHYLDVMERFGKWKASSTKSLYKAAMDEYDSTIVGLVKSAHKSHGRAAHRGPRCRSRASSATTMPPGRWRRSRRSASAQKSSLAISRRSSIGISTTARSPRTS